MRNLRCYEVNGEVVLSKDFDTAVRLWQQRHGGQEVNTVSVALEPVAKYPHHEHLFTVEDTGPIQS